jgi:hypothetical protein
MVSQAMRKILFVELLVVLAVVVVYEPFAGPKPDFGEFRPPGVFTNNLSLGADGPRGAVRIVLREPVEFDFLNKSDVLDMRREAVGEYAELVNGPYRPSEEVFGAIEDGMPWWGLMGQYCGGPGKESIDGQSEEGRFVLNPFLLLAVDDASVKYSGRGCFPVYPHPVELHWYAADSKAVVSYNMTRFMAEEGIPYLADYPFMLENVNARDFSLNYAYAEPAHSGNTRPARGSELFKRPCYLKGFIHRGGSCGYPGGCNNGSPFDQNMVFYVDELPGTVNLMLWRDKPADTSQEPDFTYIINFA